MARAFWGGNSEYLMVAATPIVAAPFSVALWAYTTDASKDQSVFWLGDKDASADFWSLILSGTAAGDPVVWQVVDSTAASATTTAGYNADGGWHHMCGVEISSVSRAAYFDGGSKGTDTTDRTPDNSDSCAIAMKRDTTPGSPHYGGIAEVGLWDVALTDAEVAILALGYSPRFVRPANLVACWPLIRDDRDIVDGYNMTPYNAPSIAAHPRIIYPSPVFYSIPAAGAPPAYTVPLHHILEMSA